MKNPIMNVINSTNPEESASKLLVNLKITSQSEINDYLEDIAFERGMLVHDDELKGAEARLIVVENTGLITVSTDVKNYHRKRFCIAHEMGHFELHRKEAELFIDESLNEWGNQRTRIEREANEFASAFLMPERFFSFRCLETNPSLDFIARLSTDFNTSLTATSLRFLRFTDKPVAVVLSTHGVVQWVAYSNSFPKQKYSTMKGQRISMRTEAANTQDSTRPMREIPALAWLEQKDSQISVIRKTRIREQSWLLGNGRFVLTLLWDYATL